MAIKLLKIEETENWCDEVRQRVSRIFGVYVFDDEQSVHCCELTPSYECHFVGSLVQFEEALLDESDHTTIEDILEGDIQTPDIQYFHVRVVDSLPAVEINEWPEGKGGISVLTNIEGDTREEQIEAAIEYVRLSLP